MTQEALKLALEALETELSIDWTNNDEFNASAEKMYEAITSIKEALAEHAMRETQRLGQEIEPVADYIAARDMLDEQPVPPRTWIGLEGAEAGWFCHTDFLNARKYTKKQREYICNQLLSEAQSWDIDQYTRMMHDSTKRPFIGLTDEDMYVVSEEESCSFIAGAKWSEAILKEKNT